MEMALLCASLPQHIAFDTAEEVLANAAESAAVTHNHPEGIKGAEAIALATFLARNGHSKDAILSAVIDMSGYPSGFLARRYS